jgi:hypothetical protein
MHTELKRMWWDEALHNLKDYPEILLDGLRKAMTNRSQNGIFSVPRLETGTS